MRDYGPGDKEDRSTILLARPCFFGSLLKCHLASKTLPVCLVENYHPASFPYASPSHTVWGDLH